MLSSGRKQSSFLFSNFSIVSSFCTLGESPTAPFHLPSYLFQITFGLPFLESAHILLTLIWVCKHHSKPLKRGQFRGQSACIRLVLKHVGGFEGKLVTSTTLCISTASLEEFQEGRTLPTILCFHGWLISRNPLLEASEI